MEDRFFVVGNTSYKHLSGLEAEPSWTQGGEDAWWPVFMTQHSNGSSWHIVCAWYWTSLPSLKQDLLNQDLTWESGTLVEMWYAVSKMNLGIDCPKDEYSPTFLNFNSERLVCLKEYVYHISYTYICNHLYTHKRWSFIGLHIFFFEARQKKPSERRKRRHVKFRSLVLFIPCVKGPTRRR